MRNVNRGVDKQKPERNLGCMAKPTPPRTIATRAAELETKLLAIFLESAKVPTFKGKAAFMDRLKKAHGMAHNLAWDAKHYPEG
jgi:hypothetical protein